MVALVGCGGDGDEAAVGEGVTNVTALAPDDPRIAAAKEEAQLRWPEFVASFRSKPSLDHSVKAPFKTQGGSREHLWLAVTAIRGTSVTGTIANEPLEDIGYRYGDEATIQAGAVEDWGIWRGDELLRGYFSRDVLTGG